MSMTVRGSVRRRLLVALLGGLVLIWIAAGTITAMEMREEVHELLDAGLTHAAAQLLHEIDENQPEHALTLFKYFASVEFQIWENGEHLRLHSANAPAQRLAAADTGFSSSVVGGRDWRVYSAWDDRHHYLVQVGETLDYRMHFAREAVLRLAQSLVPALPLFGLLVWFAVGASLRPVAHLGEELKRRDPRYLRRIDAEVPLEIAPMVAALNTLLERLEASLDHERRFTADAAHELRTPLAALRSQIEVAIGAGGDDERRRALNNALAACDSAAHLVQQLLTLARIEHGAWESLAEPCDLRQLAVQALAEAAAAAARGHIELNFEPATGDTSVRGYGGLLAILLRNLLDNAIRYSPPRTTVTVRIERRGGALVLAVSDQGPGIPADQVEHVLKRFHRLEGTTAPGSGLGLSIALRIAELHGAALALANCSDGGGLCATVQFPPPQP